MTNPWEAKEVGIAMRATFGTVNLIKVLQRELQSAGKRLDPIPKFSFGKRRKFVKEGLNDSGVQNNHDDLE